MVAAAAARAGRRRLIALGAFSIVFCVAVKGAIPMVNQKHNALMIHDAAITAGGAGARYIFLDERRLYGVQFYFDGNIERISTNGDQSWAPRDLQSVLNGFEAGPSAGRLVFITNRRGAEQLEKAMPGRALVSKRTPFYDRDIVVVQKDT